MRGYVEVKEDAYEDTIEHLYKLKQLACKMIKKLSEYAEETEEDELEEKATRHRSRFL